MDQSVDVGDASVYKTPPKSKVTFRRRIRDSTLSPGSLRARKLFKVKDDLVYERVQVMIKAELSVMRGDIEKEMYANVETCKKAMYADMRKQLDKEMLGKRDEMYTALKGEMQNIVRAEVNVMECVMRKRLEDAIAVFESWKSIVEERISEKDALIEELKGELTACKNIPGKEGENQPSMIKELENIKEQVKTLHEEEE